MTEHSEAEQVLQFWFGQLQNGLMEPDRRQGLFRADPAFDARIRLEYGADVEAALAGKRDHWSTTIRGRAALLLLLDQFTRNIFRGTPRAFAGDPQALTFARDGVSGGEDKLLALEQRVFFYLPFEHAESLAEQETSVTLFEALLAEQNPAGPAAEVVKNYLQHARGHRALIARFGRFPHRNRILDRASTPEETAWLERDARSFGQ